VFTNQLSIICPNKCVYFVDLNKVLTTARDRVHVQNDCLLVVPYECHLDFARGFLISKTSLTGFTYSGRVSFPFAPRVSSGNKVYLGHTAPGPPPSCTATHRIRTVCKNLDACRWNVMSKLGLLLFFTYIRNVFEKKDFHRVTLVGGQGVKDPT